MKTKISDANFPKSVEGRVYHLGLRAGELASRIITVGDPARARTIARYLDPSPPSGNVTGEESTSEQSVRPLLFELYSERGFLTLTGKYKGVPVSIVSIGMGAPNMDFFVREGREVLDGAEDGDMLIIRFGSCGGLVNSLPVGSLTVPKASIAITRNYDYDFLSDEDEAEEFKQAYRLSKPVNADGELHTLLLETLRENLPSSVPIIDEHLNASADSFYSSQGRITSFPDHNNGLIDYLVTQNVGSLEMETFHLLHLAANWPRSTALLRRADEKEEQQEPPPLTSMAVDPFILPSSSALSTDISSGDSPSSVSRLNGHKHSHTPIRRIRAAAVQMIFAERNSRVFISPQEVAILQEGSARGLLETLIKWRATHSPKLRSSI